MTWKQQLPAIPSVVAGTRIPGRALSRAARSVGGLVQGSSSATGRQRIRTSHRGHPQHDGRTRLLGEAGPGYNPKYRSTVWSIIA